MLIQNNTNNIVTKYISIYLKELFNNNIKVTDTYSNSPFNYFKVGENILFNRYIAFYDLENSRFLYGYAFGEIGNILEMSEGTEKPSLTITSTGEVVDFNTFLSIPTDISVIAVNSNTGDFITRSSGEYIIYNVTADTQIYVDKFNCRKTNYLCTYIYEWLESRYYPLFANPQNNLNGKIYTVNEIIDYNVANYFISNNNSLNNNKLAFDIDDFVASFILGRTISDTSTPEEIEYAQNLLSHNHYLQLLMNNSSSFNIKDYIAAPGTWGYLHELIYIYQLNLNSRYNVSRQTIVIPTGYLDIITEKYLLMELDGQPNDYYNESNSTLRTY